MGEAGGEKNALRAYFDHLITLASDMARTCLRGFDFDHLEHLAPIVSGMVPSGFVLSIWAAWPQLLPGAF